MRPGARFARPPAAQPGPLSRVGAMHTDPTLHPLAQGNRFQRAYHRWALPHYERLGAHDPELRQQVEEVDRILYTRQGLGGWLGMLGGGLGSGLGLWAAGLPGPAAFGLGLLLSFGLCFALIGVWLGARRRPSAPPARRRMAWLLGLLLALLPGLGGLLVGASMARGPLSLSDMAALLAAHGPTFLFTLLGLMVLYAGMTRISRLAYAQRLARVQLEQERDAATRQALEADLRLLQAQIHPHFVFNTLATLQHWVDKKDERAGPLLRELTGFLRRCTEMLGREQVPAREELQAVRHYLAILQQRMQERLRYALHLPEALAERPLPPGLLLTLVENAIEHGLERKIGGGSLQVQAEALGSGWRLRVDDDGLGLPPHADLAAGVGLANIRRRLQLHYGAQATLTLQALPQGGTRAEVLLP